MTDEKTPKKPKIPGKMEKAEEITEAVSIKKYFCVKCEAYKSYVQMAVTRVGGTKKLTDVCYACVQKAERNRLRAEAMARKELRERAKKKVPKEKLKAQAEKAAEFYTQQNYASELKQEAINRKRRKFAEERKKAEQIRKAAEAANAADRELASRVLARRRLLHFIQKFKPNYQAGWVHEDICDRLERFVAAVEAGESPRLILAMPPRHGKSEIASKTLPAWVLGHRPDFEIIASSYNVSLPMGFSRKVQEILRSPVYKGIFPKTALSKTSSAAEAWLTTKGGGYVAAGVGGGITGKGAHIFIIDDPVKDAEEADSETIREKTWDWWGSTAKTRLAPGGGVLVIQTRWHDDDLAGRMIRQMNEQTKELEAMIADAQDRIVAATTSAQRAHILREIDVYKQELASIDQWEVVSYPAIATDDEYEHLESHKIWRKSEFEEKELKELEKARKEGTLRELGYRFLRKKGEPLHEDRFPAPLLINMRRSMQPRHWSALYQQNPVPDEGIYFTKSMLRYEPYTPVGHEFHVYIAWDLAIGEKQTNDFTVGAVIGVDYKDQIHVLDIIRGRWDSLGIVDTIIDTAVRYQPQMVGIEKGHLEMALGPMLRKRMKERKVFFSLAEGKDALTPITDKSVRARPLQGRMQQGMVLFPSNQPWVEEAVFELLRFPGGVHDDIVDALAWAVRLSMKFSAPKPPKRQKHKSWKDKLKYHIADGLGSKHPMGV